ncbi:carbohydrate kinase family protein, partial [bacterium]|nr:carbohydrate kinase family protein [bacterium]
MKKFDVVTIGSATLDIMFHTKDAQILKNRKKFGYQHLMAFELGSKVETHDVLYTSGGGAANTAVSFSRLGFKTAAIACIGKGATGQIVMDRFKDEKIDISFVKQLEGYTGMSFVITGGKKGDRVIFVHRSVNKKLEVSKKLLNSFSTKWIYLNSLAGKPWKENTKNIFEIAKKKNIKIAWNPGTTQLDAGYPFL